MSREKQIINFETSVSSASPSADESSAEDRIFYISLDNIVPCPFEPQARRRARFKPEEIESLGDSILKQGLFSPIVVRRKGANKFEIVFGERRYLAALLKNLSRIKCFIRELTDGQVLEMQYQENHQRADSDPLGDAFLFKFLKERENYTDADLADKFAVTKREIRDKLKLNDLVPEAVAELENEQLPLRHAYYLAKFPPASQAEIVVLQLAYKYYDRTEKPVSLEVFREEVETEIVRRLDNAAFDASDARLHIKGLLCKDCPDNSAYQTHLFPELASAPRCLNRACFETKTNLSLHFLREEIAIRLPNPGSLPIEEITKAVPMVTERKYVSERVQGAAEVLTDQELLDAPECEFSKPAVAVEGEKKGKQVYVCRNSDCDVHHPPADELTRPEIDFERRVTAEVRAKILGKASEWFDDRRTLWQFDDLVKNLIHSVLFERDDRLRLVRRVFPDAPRAASDLDRLRRFAATLDKANQSKVLFILSHVAAEEIELLKIAGDYTNLDYLALDAETRLELAPSQFKAEARVYLEKVKNGDAPAPPRFPQTTADAFDHIETVFDDAAE